MLWVDSVCDGWPPSCTFKSIKFSPWGLLGNKAVKWYLCHSKPFLYINFSPGNIFISTWHPDTGFCYYVIVPQLQWSKPHLPNHHCSKRKISDGKFLFSTVLCQSPYQLILHTYGIERLERKLRHLDKKPLSRHEDVKQLYLHCLQDNTQVIHSWQWQALQLWNFKVVGKKEKAYTMRSFLGPLLGCELLLKITIPTKEE